MQLGFGFDGFEDNNNVNLSWLTPVYTMAQYGEFIERSKLIICDMGNLLNIVCKYGLEAFEKELNDISLRKGTKDPFAVHCTRVNAPETLMREFIAYCEAMKDAKMPNLTFKIRHRYQLDSYGLYIKDVGSIVVRVWPNIKSIGMVFVPYRDNYFQPSYLDNKPSVYVPYSEWRDAYSADKIAMSGDKPAAVKLFQANGRLYTIDSIVSKGKSYQGEALSFRPLWDWSGKTYTYHEQCRAWDQGILERGDRRGLIISVKGYTCVVDGEIDVYDENVVDPFLNYFSDEDENVDLEQELLEEIE